MIVTCDVYLHLQWMELYKIQSVIHNLPLTLGYVAHTSHTSPHNYYYRPLRSVVHTCTVSPVEKLTNRTTGTLPVRSRYGRGSVVVRSRSTVEVRSWYGRGTVKVLSRYAPGSLVVRYTQGSFPPCILDAPRTWYTYCSFYCSNRAIAA